MLNIFRRKPKFGEQLEALAQCGIVLNNNCKPECLLQSQSPEAFEAQPYLLLLKVMGEPAKPEMAAKPIYRSNSIWRFDLRAINGPGSYSRIAERMAMLAGSDLPLSDVQDEIDPLTQSATLSFSLEGKAYDWRARYDEERADSLILYQLAELLNQRRSTERFTYIDLGAQECLIGCSSITQKDRLAATTGLRVEWLTQVRANGHR